MPPRSSAVTVVAVLLALVLVGHQISRGQPATLHATSLGDLPAGVTVSDSVTIRDITNAAEVQSTVVPPGTKWQCPYGRLLISNDDAKKPGEVSLLSLTALGAAPTKVTPEMPFGMYADGSGYRRVLSNDHDLITLPDGDVLLVKMGQTKANIFDKNGALSNPNWFEHTYKLTFVNGMLTEAWGPGARSEILVWRSTDCGDSFPFASAIDTASLDDWYGPADDGSAALPQPVSNGQGYILGPGDPWQPAWQMGGTDGPLVRLDRLTGKVYITLGLVGRKPLFTTPGFPFVLSTEALNRTVVMASSDQGQTWKAGSPVLPYSGWRLDVVPRPNHLLAFATQGWDKDQLEGFAVVNPTVPALPLPGPPNFTWTAPEQPGKWGWNQLPWTHPILYKYNDATKDATDKMNVNMHGQPILTRSAGALELFFAYMDTLPGAGDGYRLYGYDGQASWHQFPDIGPKSSNPDDFVVHLTAVDAGRGPLLYYWYDVDTVTKKGTMRARLLVEDDTSTVDFSVSRTSQVEASFDLLTDTSYGDYHTAGAYVALGQLGSMDDVFHYFPIWKQDDGKLRVAHVTYRNPLADPGAGVIAEVAGYVRARDRVVFRREVDASRLLMLRADEDEVRLEPRRRP